MAHFFVSVYGSLFHQRLAQIFIDIHKHGIPRREKKGLPKSGDPSVPIGKRMDENKRIVEHTGADQGMKGGALLPHPGKQRLHQGGNHPRRRSNLPWETNLQTIPKREGEGSKFR